jgi:hypothetical protein
MGPLWLSFLPFYRAVDEKGCERGSQFVGWALAHAALLETSNFRLPTLLSQILDQVEVLALAAPAAQPRPIRKPRRFQQDPPSAHA